MRNKDKDSLFMKIINKIKKIKNEKSKNKKNITKLLDIGI